MANAVAFTRMKDAINRLDKAVPSPALECLFKETECSGLGVLNTDEYSCMEFFDESLNESQREAIKFSLASPVISLIHGPPGVIVSLLYCRRGKLILALNLSSN